MLEVQASATVKPPVDSTIAPPAPSVPLMGKETLYNDREGREGMALGIYGGNFAKLKPKGFAWQDRKKEEKEPHSKPLPPPVLKDCALIESDLVVNMKTLFEFVSCRNKLQILVNRYNCPVSCTD